MKPADLLLTGEEIRRVCRPFAGISADALNAQVAKVLAVKGPCEEQRFESSQGGFIHSTRCPECKGTGPITVAQWLGVESDDAGG